MSGKLWKPRAVFPFTERREGCWMLAYCCMGGQKQSVEALAWVNGADAGGRPAALSPEPPIFAGQNHQPHNSCLMVGVERALGEGSSHD